MNLKFVAIVSLIGLLSLSVSAANNGSNMTTSFPATDVRTFAFLDQRVNQTTPNFTDATYWGTEAKVSDGCYYYYGM